MVKPRANALLLAGDRLSAHEAWMGGLVTGVEDAGTADAFLRIVLKKVKRIGTFSGEALRMAKRLTKDAADDLAARRKAGERGRKNILAIFSHEDTKMRLAAFGGEKQKAKF
ncbi:Nn.00g050350.m01.CDS01 [Neocucurbitaria sp. VM-36]